MPVSKSDSKKKQKSNSKKQSSNKPGAETSDAKKQETPSTKPKQKGSSKGEKKSESKKATPKSKPVVADSKEQTKKSKPKKRPIIFKEVGMVLYDTSDPITVSRAKEMLGWTEESENIKFGIDFHVKDNEGNKIRLLNNTTNRPIQISNYKMLQSEILHGSWCLNGEPIILGDTGNILNGQHTLIGLILAAQEWHKKGGTWREYWKTEPTIVKIVVTGIEETDQVINTIDTGKSRTFVDVLYRSAFFQKYAVGKRLVLAKMTDVAIKFIWDRTGAYLAAYLPRPTHADSLDFLDRHPKILKAVVHIFEENDDCKISARINTGVAAGLLYLMSATKDALENEKGTGYSDADHPSEKNLKLKLWEKACEFWVLFAADSKEMAPVLDKIVEIAQEHWRPDERIGVFVLAWIQFWQDKKITPSTLKLVISIETGEDGEEWRVLDDIPAVGGIDLGGVAAADESDDDTNDDAE